MHVSSLGIGALVGAAAAYVLTRYKPRPPGNVAINMTLSPGAMPDVTLMPGDTLTVWVDSGSISSVDGDSGNSLSLFKTSADIFGVGSMSVHWTDGAGSPQVSTFNVVQGS